MKRSVRSRIREGTRTGPAWLLAATLCIGIAGKPPMAAVESPEPQSAASFHAPEVQLAGFITA